MSCQPRFLADTDAPRRLGLRRESSASVNVPILSRLLRTTIFQNIVFDA
jgi:hypothetical protein